MLTSSDIIHILPHYDLGDLRRVTQAPHGYVNETAFVETSCGRFVVRRNHRRLGTTAHRYRHLLIGRLRACNVPAPALIAACDGATLLSLDGRWYEVHVYIAGADYDPIQPQQLRSIGATLACYHRAVAGFAPPPEQTPPRYHPQGLLALIEQIIERDVMGDLHEPLVWYSARAAQLRAQVITSASLATRWSRCSTTTRSPGTRGWSTWPTRWSPSRRCPSRLATSGASIKGR